MRVIHLGNLANFGYRYVKALRRRGFNAELLLRYPPEPTSDPRSEDPDLFKNGLPEWIHFWYPRYRQRFSLPGLILKTWKYDLVHAYTMFSIYAMFSLKPYIAHSTGSDLRVLALKNTYLGRLMREAYRKAKMVLFGNPDLIRDIKRLNLRNTHFLPLPIDVKKYAPKKVELKNKYGYETLLFHPTSLDWGKKGNDSFLKAYIKLIQETKDVFLILIDWGLDKERTKILLRQAGADKYVKFLPLMDQENLIRYYNAADIIADQFIIGSLGGISIEAMSCGKPVVMYISEEHFKLCYPELPPVVNARTEDQIFEKLYDLVMDEPKRKQIGKKSRQWILNYHHWKKISRDLIKIYESLS